MLYVFQVDTGTMMTFEMKLAMESVGNLKKAIHHKSQLPEDKQVLLISGGESLKTNSRVCSYSSAGTDTSPIFLFTKINVDTSAPQAPTEDDSQEANTTEMIEDCLKMAPSLDTLFARTELAATLNAQATRLKETCETLVHDQHLQQQGWAAVVANLEDLTRAFNNKADMLMVAFKDFVDRKTKREELLGIYREDLQLLDSIPILPVLMESNKSSEPSNQSITGSNEQQDPSPQTTSSASCSTNPSSDQHSVQSLTSSSSLLQWIESHDGSNNLEKLADYCWRGLERFTEQSAEQINNEVQDVLKQANNSNMKEIKGLEERLFGLEKLMLEAKKVVDEQNQLSASFQNNRDRFSKIKDLTLLPDLSQSHKQQLQMMLTNHKKMIEYRNRCMKAKYELSVNLHNRLKWIMYIEQQISDLDGKIMIYKENLSRLKRHFDIIEQVHAAPEVYLNAISETMRRRRFARSYTQWTLNIAKKSSEIYEKELETRKAFDRTLSAHFLSKLFPGLLRSYPQPFATVPPEPFDLGLPRVTASDINRLQENLCHELANKLTIPKDVALPHLVTLSKETPTNNEEEKKA